MNEHRPCGVARAAMRDCAAHACDDEVMTAARKLDPVEIAEDDLDREDEVLRRGSLGNPSATPADRAAASALLGKMLDRMAEEDANRVPIEGGGEELVLRPEEVEEVERMIAETDTELRAGRYYTADDVRAKLRRAGCSGPQRAVR